MGLTFDWDILSGGAYFLKQDFNFKNYTQKLAFSSLKDQFCHLKKLARGIKARILNWIKLAARGLYKHVGQVFFWWIGEVLAFCIAGVFLLKIMG